MSGRQWTRLTDRLASSHRVVVPDLLGYGANPRWPGDRGFTLAHEVAAVRALAQELGEPAHWVGHSYGGLIALLLALEAPTLVRSLSLYEPVAFGVLHALGDALGLADLAKVEASPVFADVTQGGSEAWMREFIDYWSGSGAWEALAPTARAGFLVSAQKTFLEVKALMAHRVTPEGWRGLEIPTLVLSGSRSPPSARRVAMRLPELLPQARWVELPGAGHLGPLTQANEVNALIAEHIASVEGTH